MAKPLQEISKTDFSKKYNVVKVLTDKLEIMKQLKTFNSNNQAVAFGVRKKPKVTLEDVMKEIINIKADVKKIKSRIDRHDQLFKQHGWI